MKKLNLVGQTFGRLKVLEEDNKREEEEKEKTGKHLNTFWLCQCSCEAHNIVSVSRRNLTNGNTKSCGCLHHENVLTVNKKENKYDLSGEYGIGYTCNNGKEFYFDKEDYDKIKNYCWVENSSGYITTNIPTSEGSGSIYLHKLITNTSKEIIDHKNRKKYDNRKENLSVSTRKKNGANHETFSTNTSGFTGVIWDKSRQKWVARLKYNYKNYYLGDYENKEDAIIARLKAEKEYFKEDAPQRHLFEQYGIK